MRNPFYILFFLLALSNKLTAQQTFEKTFGSDSTTEGGNSIISIADGGYAVAGLFTQQALITMLLNLTAWGNVQWQKSFGGPGG
jgi:hypothetical protein